MINFSQYIADATRTESIKPELKVDSELVNEAFNLAIAATRIMDGVKKNAFYGKPLDMNGMVDAADWAADTGDTLIDRLARPSVEDHTIKSSTRIAHGIIGIFTEAGELVEALDRAEFGVNSELDMVNLGEEIGDLMWYIAVTCDAAGLDFEELLIKNVAKLRARYGAKFSSAAAINRDVKAEREILEGVA